MPYLVLVGRKGYAMKTFEQVLAAVQDEEAWARESAWLDGRDLNRLTVFATDEQLGMLGFKRVPGASPRQVVAWTQDAVMERLESDLAFAYEKAYGRRGISAALMYDVIKMWLWILEDSLAEFQEYSPYGLPLLRAVSERYGLCLDLAGRPFVEADYG